MGDLSRSVPPASRLLAGSVRAYRAGFPGVARAFLPVFAVFALGQVGLALWGEASTFGGLIARALALAGVGVVEIVFQAIAMFGLMASTHDLPSVSTLEIYRRGARLFWPSLWVAALLGCALSVVPAAALLVSPAVVRLAAVAAATVFGTLASAVTAAFSAAAVFGFVAAAATFVVLARVIFAAPLVATGVARGRAALEASAGLSDGRAWTVAARLAAGAAATVAVVVPFVLLLVATARPGSASIGSPWAWGLFAAAYLLVAVPFALVFISNLLASLRDTAAERAAARGPRLWVRVAVWVGAAVWAFTAARAVF